METERNFTRVLVFLPSADLNNVRFSAYRTAMKLRRLQKALCCKHSPPVPTYIDIYVSVCVSHGFFFRLSLQVHSSVIMSPSHCAPALLHSSFVLPFPPSSCLFCLSFFFRRSPHAPYLSSTSSPRRVLLCVLSSLFFSSRSPPLCPRGPRVPVASVCSPFPSLSPGGFCRWRAAHELLCARSML